jgi:hypothetical protein
MRKLLALSLFAILLVACGPSQAEHDAAVQTQVALLIQQQAAGTAGAQPTTAVPADGEPTFTSDPEFPIPADAACTPDATPRVVGIVEDVWDGVSIGVDINGVDYEVRYIGVDEGGNDASLEANRSLVEGKQVLLIQDETDRDEYGRLLRFVIADGVFVNAELLRRGAVFLSPEEPDLSCANFFQGLTQ